MKKYTKKQIAEATEQVAKYGAIVEKLLDKASAKADKANAAEKAKAKTAGTNITSIAVSHITVNPKSKHFADVCHWFNAAIIAGDVAGSDELITDKDGKSMHYQFRGGAVVGNYQPTLIVEHTTAKYLSITLF